MWVLYGLTILGGLGTGLQPGLNSTLRSVLGQPIVAAFVSVTGTILALVLAGALTGGLALPEFDRWAAVPGWAWFAGVMGAALILAQIYAAREIGAGPFLSITVATALITSLLLDHFGLVGFKEHALNAGRIVGAALMVGGVLLVSI